MKKLEAYEAMILVMSFLPLPVRYWPSHVVEACTVLIDHEDPMVRDAFVRLVETHGMECV